MATYEFGVGKFPGLVLVERRDLYYEGRRRNFVDKQVRGKRRQTHPADNLEAVHIQLTHKSRELPLSKVRMSTRFQ